MLISFIIVNHKSENYLSKCLETIEHNLTNGTYEIIIVNNDSSKLNLKKPIKFFNQPNIGYARACNLGAKHADGEYLCFLNPDTEILTTTFEKILNCFKNKVGIISPQLVIDKLGLKQPWSNGHFPTLFQILKNNFKIKDNHAHWVSGAALIIPQKLFDQLNGFDEQFFLYFEDVDLCKRAADLGFKVKIDPSFQVLHYGGRSSKNKADQKLLYYKSQDYYFKKHRNALEYYLLRFFRLFH